MSNTVFQRNLFLDQGTDYTLGIVLEDHEGNPITEIDTCEFLARPDTTSKRFIRLRTEFIDSTIFVTAPETDTRSFIPGRYIYNLDYTDITGMRVKLLSGILTIRDSISVLTSGASNG